MQTIPAGWHPDPSGRHEWRHWDGQRWTDHVADGGVTTVDPLPPNPAPAQTQTQTPTQTQVQAQPHTASPATAGEYAVVDTEVKAGLKGGRRIVVTNRAFYDGRETYPLDDVQALNHVKTRFTTSGRGTLNMVYEVYLDLGGRKPVRIYWSGQGPHELAVYNDVVAALHRFVAPRLVADMVKRIAAGETIELSGLAITADGMARKKLLGGGTGDVVPWSAPLYLDSDEFGYIVVTEHNGKPDRFAAVPYKTMNAALLPNLLHAFTG